MKQKVLILSHAYYPNHVGGAEVAIREITKRLGDTHEFTMITLSDGVSPKTEIYEGITIHRVSPGIHTLIGRVSFILTAFLKALSLHRKEHFNTIWMMMSQYAGIAGLLFSWIHPHVHRVLSLQEGDPIPDIERRLLPIKPIFNAAFRRPHTVQVISTYLADWARTKKAQNITVIPNGVSLELFSKKDAVRKDGTTLFTSSRLVYKNGHDLVIKALPELPDVTYVIAGSGPLEQELKQLAQTLGVSERVTFLGYIPYEQIPWYLHSADMFIRMSRSEGLGNAFLEAMAAETPVIGTDAGGIKDFLKDEITGKVAYVDNPESIVKAVQFYQNKEKKREIVQSALKLVQEQYDWNTIAEKFRTLL